LRARASTTRHRHRPVTFGTLPSRGGGQAGGVSSETYVRGTEVRTLSGRVVWVAGALPLDARIARVADAQHGVLTLAQLRRCGLSDRAVRGRVKTGRLYRVHRAVYTPGHRALPRLGAIAAAVLACGFGALVSHRTASWLHAMRPDARGVIDITVGASWGRRHGHVVGHSAKHVGDADVTIVDGIPVTSISRTLLDCAAELDRHAIERMCQKAAVLRTFDRNDVARVLASGRGHPGWGTLGAAVADAAGARGIANPGTEDALLLAFRAAGLPEPECNAAVQRPDGSWAFADFLWREGQVIVEADTAYHNSTASYRSDRQRDRALLALGYETIRFSDEDLRDPAACAAETRELLAALRPQKRTSRVRS
jgi:very-short-patch-repair endonuclease